MPGPLLEAFGNSMIPDVAAVEGFFDRDPFVEGMIGKECDELFYVRGGELPTREGMRFQPL